MFTKHLLEELNDHRNMNRFQKGDKINAIKAALIELNDEELDNIIHIAQNMRKRRQFIVELNADIITLIHKAEETGVSLCVAGNIVDVYNDIVEFKDL